MKAAISKDNVFQLVVAVSNHSMTLSNECMRYIGEQDSSKSLVNYLIYLLSSEVYYIKKKYE